MTILGAAAPAQAGPVGLLVIVLLAVATLLLVRSMGKHLRKVPESFDPPADDPPDKAPGRVE